MSRPPEIIVRNWGKFQHYKKRNPPWIRLYRDLIDSHEWRHLSDSAARLLIELWLLASEFEPGGRVPYDTMLLAWRTGRASTDASANASIVASLQELADQRFIGLPNYASANASTFASANASTSTRQRQSTETEPTPFLRARDEPTDALTEWLGEYAHVLEDCELVEDHAARRTLHTQFGPPALRANAWRFDNGDSVPEEDRPRLLAIAISGYAGEGNTDVITSEFAGLLRRVIRDEGLEPQAVGKGATGFVSTDADYEPGGIYGPPADA